MRGMNLNVREGKDPDGSPAFLWEVKFFKRVLGAGWELTREKAEKAAAHALGEALAKQIVTSRDRGRAKAKLADLCERRPYLVLGVARLIMRDGTMERILREAAEEEQATFNETPAQLRLIPLPTDPRAMYPEDAAKRMIALAVKAGMLSWKEEGVLECKNGFKSFMIRQFGAEALGLPPNDNDNAIRKALDTLGAKAPRPKKAAKRTRVKGKKRKARDENEDDYPAMGEL